MNCKTLLGGLAVLAAAGASLFAATPALADEGIGSPGGELTYSVTAPMYISGYDEARAEANGYTIVIDEDGNPHSIPVTEEAQAEAAAAAAAYEGTIRPFNTVFGDCGSSSLFISRSGSTTLVVSTGYAVIAPSVGHTWNVDGAVTSGAWSEGFSGLAFSSSWSAVHNVSVGNNSSGFGLVRPGSEAYLANGLTCTSGGPSDSW